MQTLMTVCFGVVFILTLALERAGTSYMSHVGGFAYGLLAALLLLPTAGHRRLWRVVLPACGAVALVVLTSALAATFYLQILPSVCCGC
jgi:hypothetical protein